MVLSILLSSAGSGARAQDRQITVPEAPGAAAVSGPETGGPQPVTELPLPQLDAQPDTAPAADADRPLRSPASLDELVAATPVPASLPAELECLAGAIYFEAKSETLAGQLAVGRVVVARAASGRFPASYCGVVYQPSQFSFVRGRAMPPVNHDSRAWQQAVRLALIAHTGAWRSPAEGAMYFHAARVSPNWGRARIARIDNHVFYR